MNPLFQPVNDSLTHLFQERLDDRHKRERVAQDLMVWLAQTAVKKPVVDLPDRLEKMRKATERMMEDMTITVERGKIKVTVAGASEDTWRMYRLGSTWFEADNRIVERVLAALFASASSYIQ